MAEIKLNKILYNSILLILSAITAYILFLVFSNLNKGFELSDESYYGLATQYPLQTRTFASCFGLINSKFCFGNYHLYSLRLFKFYYQIISLLCFCLALYYFISKKFPEKSQIAIVGLFMVFISGFSNYDYLPQTLSYNSWSLNFSLLFCSAFLLICVNENKKLHFVLCCFIGFILAALFYTKLPNAIILFFVFMAYHVLFLRKLIWINLSAVILGVLLSLFFLFGNFPQIKQSTSYLLQDIFQVNHVSLSTYFEQIYTFLFVTLDIRLLIMEGLMFASLFFLKHKIKLIIGFVLLLANTILTFKLLEGNSARIENDFSFLILIIINALVLFKLFGTGSSDTEGKKFWYVIISFIFLPLLLAMGTNNSLFYTGSQLMVFALAACLLLLIHCNTQATFLGLSLISALCGIFIICILKQGMILTPYRQTNLSDKNLPLYFSETTNKVYESRERFAFLYQLFKKLKTNNSEAYPICADFSYVGAAYLTSNKTLPIFWLPDPGYGYQKVKESFKSLKFNGEKVFVLISSKNANDKTYLEILKENKLDLGAKWMICDSLYVNYNKEYIYFYKSM